ncbi:MAG: GTP-binding protein [Promethearchaeota archaeon]
MLKLKIIVAGAKSVGKTSLIKRYCTGSFDMNTLSTIGVDFMVKTLKIDENTEIVFSLWDFAGESKFRQLFPSYCSGASGTLLLFDITNESSFEELNDWLKLINNASSGIIKFLIGSKTDLEDDRVISVKQALEFKKENNLDQFMETSAKTGNGVEKVFQMMAEFIIKKALIKCPFCGELIQKMDPLIFCSFCGKKLNTP